MITIHVKQTHIDQGKPICIYNCALALAISESIGKTCVVGVERVNLKGNPKARTFLPPAAIQFRHDFDSEKFVESFSFELDSALLGDSLNVCSY